MYVGVHILPGKQPLIYHQTISRCWHFYCTPGVSVHKYIGWLADFLTTFINKPRSIYPDSHTYRWVKGHCVRGSLATRPWCFSFFFIFKKKIWLQGLVHWGKGLISQRVLCHQQFINLHYSYKTICITQFHLWILVILFHLQIYIHYIFSNCIHQVWDMKSYLILSHYQVMFPPHWKEMLASDERYTNFVHNVLITLETQQRWQRWHN